MERNVARDEPRATFRALNFPAPIRTTQSQPGRYSFVTNRFASGRFVTRNDAESHSSRRRERIATLASNTDSVNGPEYSKLDPGSGPPLQPSNHSAKGPSLTRGIVRGGRLEARSRIFTSGMMRTES